MHVLRKRKINLIKLKKQSEDQISAKCGQKKISKWGGTLLGTHTHTIQLL